MVRSRRFPRFLFPLALYVLSAGLSTYFLWHANNGNRGLRTKVEFRAQARTLREELAVLKAERLRLERSIAMMRAEFVERDILEEEARRQLGRVHKNDVVIFLSSQN